VRDADFQDTGDFVLAPQEEWVADEIQIAEGGVSGWSGAVPVVVPVPVPVAVAVAVAVAEPITCVHTTNHKET
jgi:hypothetical protein